MLEIAAYSSPIGKIVVAVRAGRLCALEFAVRWPRRRRALERRFTGVQLRSNIDPGGVVSGIVRDAKTGAPVANASVDLFDRGVNTVLFGQYYKPAPFGVTDLGGCLHRKSVWVQPSDKYRPQV